MATLRETIQAKITAAEGEAATLKQELADLEAKGVMLLDHEIEVVKEWFASIGKHIGL